MQVGDLVRDVRCGTLCIIKKTAHDLRWIYAVVWSCSGNEEVMISVDNLELVE